MASETLHVAQHFSFFITAALFWWVLIHGRYGRMGYGAAVAFVFLTGLHNGALGALLTMSDRPWYPVYAARAQQWQVNAASDQQLAGMIMWIPAGTLTMVLGLALFAAWLGEAERRQKLSRIQQEISSKAVPLE
jgi:cytochrome c oxidase assembly factor CtaG